MYSMWNSVFPCVLLCLFSSVAVASATDSIYITEKKATKQEGSCVTINCKYKFQDEMHLLWIKDPKWNNTQWRFDGTIVYSNTKERPQVLGYSDRVEFVHETIDSNKKLATCTLNINNLKNTDSGNYAFRYIKGNIKYKGDEFKLTVTDNPCKVQIKPNLNKSFREGDNVSFYCVTSAACKSYPDWLVPDSDKIVRTVDDEVNEEKSRELKFTARWTDDGRTLTCQPSGNYDSCLKRSISLTVEYAPKETKVIEGSSSMDMKKGEKITISCSSKANPKAHYTWFKNESPFSHNGETLTLHLTAPENGGIYFCQAKNEHGSEDSLGKKINVIYAPEGVNISPQYIELKEGDTCTLTCLVKNSNPAVDKDSYTWYRDVNVLTGQKMNTYTLFSVTRHDKGKYYCNATNSVGETRSTQHAIVSVKYVPQDTQIEGRREIKLGSNLNLTCATEADPSASKYYWYFKPEREQHFLTISWTRQDYQIQKVAVSDTGFYKCSAENSIGPGPNSTEMNVLVLYPPKKPNLIMEDVVKENEVYNIRCTVESSPLANLMLRRSSSTNSERDKVIESTVSSNVLNFTAKASVSDAGVYTCTAKNTEGENSSENQLKVLYAPKNVLASASPGKVLKEGSNLELTCEAESVPQASNYTWKKSFQTHPVTVGHGQKITIRFLNSSDSGHYLCISSNEVGSSSSSPIYIRVKYRPRIKIIHNMTSLGLWEKKHPVHLICSVQCDPPATFFAWYKLEENTTVLSNNQNYTVQPQNPGTYYCYASNEEGKSKSEPVEIYLNRIIIERLIQVIISLLAIVFLIGIIFLLQRVILRKRSSGKNETAQWSFFFSAAPLWFFSNLRSSGSHNTRDNLVMEGSTELSGFRVNHSATAVHSNPPANRNKQARRPNYNIHTVYDAVKLPPSMPIQHHTEEDLRTTVNYAMLQFADSNNPNKSVSSRDGSGPVYAEVSKNKEMAKKQQGGNEDYENVSGAGVTKRPFQNINWDSDSSESEEEEDQVNYTKVSFTVTSHHNPQKKFSSDEEDKTEYSEVKM